MSLFMRWSMGVVCRWSSPNSRQLLRVKVVRCSELDFQRFAGRFPRLQVELDLYGHFLAGQVFGYSP
jgi:hypothetical protein